MLLFHDNHNLNLKVDYLVKMDKLVENFLLQEKLFWREGIFGANSLKMAKTEFVYLKKKGVCNRKTGYTMWNEEEENLH